MKYLLSTWVVFTIILRTTSAQQVPLPEVKAISAMKKVMLGEDLSAHVQWDSLKRENLYALAPLGRIQGEVTILNGVLYASTVDKTGKIVQESDWQIQSPFAVYANVPQWVTLDVDESIQSEVDLQQLIEKIAQEVGIDLNKPFPFRLISDFQSVSFHIISKPVDEVEHNHNLHDKAKKHFTLEHTSGELLGFYSKNHEGVFTHKGSFVHTHFIDKKRENTGHLENLILRTPFKILLPDIQ